MSPAAASPATSRSSSVFLAAYLERPCARACSGRFCLYARRRGERAVRVGGSRVCLEPCACAVGGGGLELMVPAPQILRPDTGRSFNGRTRGSGPRYRGSNPCLPATSVASLLRGCSAPFQAHLTRLAASPNGHESLPPSQISFQNNDLQPKSVPGKSLPLYAAISMQRCDCRPQSRRGFPVFLHVPLGSSDIQRVAERQTRACHWIAPTRVPASRRRGRFRLAHSVRPRRPRSRHATVRA